MRAATVRSWTTCLWALFVTPLVLVAADPTEDARKSIVAAYQRTLVALERGDAEAAMQMDTNDWVSVTVGQKPRTRQEMEPFIRRDIGSMKPPRVGQLFGSQIMNETARRPVFRSMI